MGGKGKARGALEHREMRRLLGDQRDRLDPGRSGADDRDALAGELDLVMRPAAGEIDLALEVFDAIDLRRLRRGETAGGHDVVPAGYRLPIVGGEPPAFRGLIPGCRRDPGVKADVAPQIIAVGDEMLAHVRDQVFPFIKSLGGEDQPFSRHMQDAVFIIPKPALLVEAIGIIDDLYTEIERERQEQGQTFHDTQGDLYEHLLAEISTAGKNGQFRTPRHIIQMICGLVDPKLGDLICDPACGTGGFLLGAYQHILTAHTSPALRHTDDNGMERGLVGDELTDERQWTVLREHTFHGYDYGPHRAYEPAAARH